jgi:hypothetical protein
MPSYQATVIGGVGVNPADSQSLKVNSSTGALLVDVSGTMPALDLLAGPTTVTVDNTSHGKTAADTLKFYAASVAMTVLQFG